MLLYHNVTEIYSLLRIVVTPTICALGWLLLGRAAAKHLHSLVYWFLPAMIGASLGTTALLLEAYVSYYARRDYALATVVYLLYIADVPFHLVSFVRLWKTITRLPLSPGDTPLREADQDETVWPPQPRR